MRHSVSGFAVAVSILAFLLGYRPELTTAQVPDTISVQFAIDSAGVPVNTSQNVLIRLYRSDGGLLVKSFALGVVPVVDGILNVDLPVADVTFGEPMELGLKVGTDPEMTPRTPLSSVPFALSLRGVRVRRDDDPTFGETVSIVGGASTNVVLSSAVGGTISGGGATEPGNWNRVHDHFGTIGGGYRNVAGNAVGGDASAERWATVGGGLTNQALGEASTIAGGRQNTASGEQSFIGSGNSNAASGNSSVIGGGVNNDATQTYATVSGGVTNKGLATGSTVGGGTENEASGQNATVAGGEDNTASGNNATVAGGGLNEATASFATVAGGRYNAARGLASFAGGVGAKAEHTLSFVWNGSSGVPSDSIHSTGSSQFVVRADGGLHYRHENALVFVADERGIMPGTNGIYNLGSTALRWDSLWANYPPIITSDLREKSDVQEIGDGLERALALRPVSYQLNERPGSRQLGLIAQEAVDVVPEVVVASSSGYGVQYGALVPVLISAIQKQQRLIEHQSARIERLERRLID